MKKTISFIAALIMGSAIVSAQEGLSGTVTYSLPQTTISLEVEAVQEKFFAGPYSKYAMKYLGIEADEEDRTTHTLTDVKITPLIEADMSARYTVTLPSKKEGGIFLQMTSQGLISTSDGLSGRNDVWRFPSIASGDFSSKGVNSNLTSESITLYRKTRTGFGTESVTQDVIVAKTDEQKAAEAADMIIRLRNTRIRIVTGDTDADYSGEAMAAALDEINRLEKEYLSLFIGYSEYQTQKARFDVVPAEESRNHVYVAFRLSDTEGLVAADNLSGRPYFLDITSNGLASRPISKSQAKGSIIYRIPDICSVKLTDGTGLILQTRIPVYQFGVVDSYQVK